MDEEKFKLPLSSYEELVKIIKAYGHVSEPLELAEVSKLVGMHHTVISRNVGFLVVTGILEHGAKKVPTHAGRSLAHALEHEMPDEIRKWWTHIVNENDFLTKILTSIRIRNGMDVETLEAHIAYSAGQPKKPQFMTGSRTVIDILRAAEMIKEEDGKIVIDASAQRRESDITVKSTRQSEVEIQKRVAPPEIIVPAYPSGVQIRIQINVNCSADDVAGLGSKLKSMIEELVGNKSDDLQVETKDS